MNAPPSFREGVEIAREDLSIAIEKGAFDSAKAWKTIVKYIAMRSFEDIRKAEANFGLTSSILSDLISLEINRADNNAFSFDVLSALTAEYLETSRPMPEVLAQWAASMMRGEKKRPVRNGKYALGTLERNTYIWPVLEKLVKRGMTATRNDASPPLSACDAVAEALKQLNKSPSSYASVKRIWNFFQRYLNRLPVTRKNSIVKSFTMQ